MTARFSGGGDAATAPLPLAELAAALGEPTAAAANRPIALDDPSAAWFVEQGALDVFLIEYGAGEPVSSAQHLLRAEAGRLVFGAAAPGSALAAFAKGLPGSRLRRVRLDELQRRAAADELAAQVDAWLSDFAAAVAGRIEPRPRPDRLLALDEPLDAEDGCVLSTRLGAVVWAAVDDPSAVAYLGTEVLPPGGSGLAPLTAESWLTLQRAGRAAARSSVQLGREGQLFNALAEFHELALGAEQLNRLLALADEANEQTARAAHRRLDEQQARQSLFSVLGPSAAPLQDRGSALLAALALIGRREGIEFRQPARGRGADAAEASLHGILNASGVRARRVRLSSEERWWLGDSGALLGFQSGDGRPLALLPGWTGRYRAVDPASGRSIRLNRSRADDIEREAWLFYRPLPEGRAATAGDVLGLIGHGMAADFGRFAAAGLLASLLMLAPAIALGMLVDWLRPAASGGMLVQAVIALAAFALLGVLLQMLQGTALMRLEGRGAARAEAALWDRALGLPSSFFRGFTAGELAVRMSAFRLLRDRVSGAVANALLSSMFLLPTLGLLFIYDAALAWLSLAAVLLLLALTCAAGMLQLAPQRRRFAAERRLAGQLFQFINGMSKLRAAGAEASAFAAWARGYREQHLAGIQLRRSNEHLVALNAAVPALVGALLFAAVLWQGAERVAVSDFLVVYAVSMTFYSAIAALGRSFEAIAAVIPGYEQVQPILAALPEPRPAGGALTELSGGIRFDRVSFRYSAEGPLILNEVSMHARPGEFVAVVGESGAGKSTLIRLALGLEEPSGGGVYYDGRDLAHLDRSTLRRQLGVVIQDGALQPGNILESIIGVGGDLTIEDAWRAARLAAVDEDIAAMPMGMFTIVGDSSATFSGGQAQRIRIAAALVRNPRIVFLDEATSWLDARSQARVMEGIESLAATRIVIAHRLSTIRKAERIYVLQAGRIVQEGSFEELNAADGIFRNLVQRQLA